MNTKTKTPRETDTELAALWAAIYKAEDQAAAQASYAKQQAGAKYYYRGRQRVTDMSLEEAKAILAELAELAAAYKAEHGYTEERSYGAYHGTNWDAWTFPRGLQPREADEPAERLAKLAEAEAKVAELHEQAEALEATYTGWSRFFLVTSSAGHVHSSTSCHTCRPTTRYGWLPELSGKSEAEAVKDLGPTLCTVCFPSAPLDWTSGKKLTAAQAAKRAA